ncbi:MAG: DEAD/DEAH box helicase [Hyphomicrobiales bacterium]
MIEFEGVAPALGQALAKRGYSALTPVQAAVLAPELANADALVSAQTGSGKTVAFGLAIAPTLLADEERFARADKPLALVVAPTRELALQVKRELDWLYGDTGAVITSCVGGMDARTERRALERGTHIVVGTPGRLCDHIRRNGLDTSHLKAVVLDEADEMLDLGFREDLEFILEATPEERRTLLFSATVPATIAKLAKRYQRDAVRVTTSEEKKQHIDIEYRVLSVAPRERENAIINVLRYYEAENALVFCNTRASVNRMVARFNNRGFQVVALSGELSQNERTHALQALRDGRARVCIATDVAARGIDLPKLELVIHAELPTNPDTLLHRSGRTGRAGRKGISALIVDNKGRGRAERLLRFAKIDATWTTPPSADDVNRRDEERMLADPILTAPLTDDETSFAQRLLADHSPEQIAAAFLRLNKAGQSAPEDLQNVSAQAPKGSKGRDNPREAREPRGPRVEFENSVWISLSVGRKQNAEPRWLIPMICNAANLTKRDIGAITMQTEETFVQLNAENADEFFSALGKNQTMERNIRVKRLDGAPKTEGRSNKRSGRDGSKKNDRSDRRPKKYAGKKPGNRKPFEGQDNNEGAGKSARTDKPARSTNKDGSRAERKAASKRAGSAPKKNKVWDKTAKSSDTGGNSPLKRPSKPKRPKKPKKPKNKSE